MDIECLKAMLREDEGFVGVPKPCPTGHLSIGYGHNLDAGGISKEAAEVQLDIDVHEKVDECRSNIDFWDSLDDPRQTVLANLAFNMGISGLLKFKNTLRLMREGKHEAAAEALKNSKWYGQVQKSRSDRLIEIMRSGKLPELRDGGL
jgi:lysozyme